MKTFYPLYHLIILTFNDFQEILKTFSCLENKIGLPLIWIESVVYKYYLSFIRNTFRLLEMFDII